jgi:hypothetical protein
MIALMMEAASTSGTLVNYQGTQHKNPEDSHFHAHCNENLKSHKPYFVPSVIKG